jgi:deoxycytidine triphosphate deaminase/cell division protein FtsB
VTFYATSEEDAKARFQRFSEIDPFPDIPPALLNSSDIRSYVGATGLIFPFNDAKEKLKTASYEVDLLGRCVFWDENNQKQDQEVKEGDEFILRKNSIAFVTLRPTFRLPQYIALRFNLKITNVYRGILLGTGPLVDPGYDNRLYIPLHNLTNNDYVFKGGEGLIWMEFTKLSYPSDANALKTIDPLPKKWMGDLAKFDEQKNKLRSVEDYIRKGEPHRSVRSSIPAVFHQAQEAAKSAREAVKTFEKRFAIGGIITLAITLIFGVFPIISLVHDVNNTATEAARRLEASERLIKSQQERQDQLDAHIEGLRKDLLAERARKGQNKPLSKANGAKTGSANNDSR